MKVILKRGGDYTPTRGPGQRFEASETPQDVPAPFARAMLGRGPDYAVEAPTAAPQGATAEAGGSDEGTD
jgi:hypothetical protein